MRSFVKKVATPPASHKIHYDSEHKGFGLRVTKTGTKAFILNYHLNKRERRITIGQSPIWSAAAARERARELSRLIDQGIDPLDEKTERREAPTVATLWVEYEKVHIPTLSQRSQADQKGMWANFILPELGTIAVRQLSSRQIDSLHAKISEKPPTHANRVLEVLRKALNLSIRWEWITKNPADGFRRNTEHSREKYLTMDQYERVFSALEMMPNQKAANAIRLLILTGARRGEVLDLEWQDLDLELGIWNRPPHKSKDRKRKRIPLSNEALMLLRVMHDVAGVGFLFPTSKGTHCCRGPRRRHRTRPKG
ncbi:integrase arm-type DNA-binding domain-containing protein [Tropicibacter sp. Alg240-R139]|uniref:tyrosine-type recombinase/integrase n=1 Tax=Tropicibacter sp. Alg240-R139 TaxID=2305991 RepID=UPI0013DEB815|nr:integrase arm-type DNA-binding domain-containing protein [Tropicibacter sp. Alg240-R139]